MKIIEDELQWFPRMIVCITHLKGKTYLSIETLRNKSKTTASDSCIAVKDTSGYLWNMLTELPSHNLESGTIPPTLPSFTFDFFSRFFLVMSYSAAMFEVQNSSVD